MLAAAVARGTRKGEGNFANTGLAQIAAAAGPQLFRACEMIDGRTTLRRRRSRARSRRSWPFAQTRSSHTHTTFPAQRHARALGPDKIQTNFEGMGVFLGLVGTRTSFEVGVVVGVHPWF